MQREGCYAYVGYKENAFPPADWHACTPGSRQPIKERGICQPWSSFEGQATAGNCDMDQLLMSRPMDCCESRFDTQKRRV
jgi:hypothetical protein